MTSCKARPARLAWVPGAQSPPVLGWASCFWLVLWLLVPAFGWTQPADASAMDTSAEPEEEIVVISPRSLAPDFEGLANLSSVSRADMGVGEHAHDLLAGVPGLWVVRGSGQEHLTALRSPVLTGPGACGAFLILEQGIPIRPVGFCNINNLFEVNLTQAASVEVVRGPASGLYGGNALHGVIHVRPQTPGTATGGTLSFVGGPWNYLNGALSHEYVSTAKNQGFSLSAQVTNADGWRPQTSRKQIQANFSHRGLVSDWQILNSLAVTDLRQHSAGFITGLDAYKDRRGRRVNQNPNAYRNAWAVRANSEWRGALSESGEIIITPYLRHSKMDFRQHFLPGQPTERNGQYSGGIFVIRTDQINGRKIRFGVQAEYWRGYLGQRQDQATTGSAFLVATRPAGQHYDYRVKGLVGALFHDFDLPLTGRWDWFHTLRLEYLGYDYNNQMLDGNTRDDGTLCGFGGCNYSRPADRKDSFFNLAGRAGFKYQLHQKVTIYVMAGKGFRPPQATELYRLQSGQKVADLKTEVLYNLELGLSGDFEQLSWQLALFRQYKSNLIFRDANGFNVAGGKTSGYGLEAAFNWQFTPRQRLNAALSFTSYKYGFSRRLAGMETITQGNEVDTAPKQLISLRYHYSPMSALTLGLEWLHQGAYQLDAANTAQYGGHHLLNFRLNWRLSLAWQLKASVMNITDEIYADRADFAFGNFRYFPGLPPRAFVEIEYSY